MTPALSGTNLTITMPLTPDYLPASTPTVTSTSQLPIGIFDSGVGGLSVLRHIREQLPHESLSYFADAGFAPYGDKAESVIIERTLCIAEHMIHSGIKALVVACNTATAAAITHLRTRYPELILIGVEPGIKPAASISRTGCVGVLATSGTIASAKYQTLCAHIQQSTAINLIHQPCPGLMELIERGELDSPATHHLLTSYLQPMLAAGADTIVLGCTHYPFIASTIRCIAAEQGHPAIHLIDTGLAVASQLQRLLTKQHKLAQAQPTQRSTLTFRTSGDITKFTNALEQLLHLTPAEYTLNEMFST